jgi:hypothetical protein
MMKQIQKKVSKAAEDSNTTKNVPSVCCPSLSSKNTGLMIFRKESWWCPLHHEPITFYHDIVRMGSKDTFNQGHMKSEMSVRTAFKHN